MNKKTGKIARNSFFLASGKGFEMLVALLSAIIIARYLGAKGFGQFAFIRAIGFIAMPLIDSGAFNIVVRDICIDFNRAGRLLVSCLLLNIITCCVIVLCAWGYFSVADSHEAELPICIYWVIIAQTFMMMQKIILSVFIAAEKMIYSSVMQSVQKIILLVLYLVMIFFNLGLTHIFGAVLAANCISFALTAILLLKKFSFQITGWHPKQMGYLIKESYVIMVSAVLSEGRSYANIFLLKSMSTLNQVSFFQIPHRIITPLQIIPRSMILAIFPTFSQMGSRADDRAELSLIYQSMVKYMTLIFTPICVLVCLGASPIVLILFGKPFLASVLPLQICIWGIWFFSLSAIMEDLLIAINRQQLIGIGTVIGLIANIGVAVYLIPEHGASGASVGLVSGNIAHFTVLFMAVSRMLKQVHFFQTIYKIVGAGILMAVAAVVCQPWIHLFAALLLSFMVYVGCIYKFNTLNDNEWHYLKTGGLKIKSKILPAKKSPKQI